MTSIARISSSSDTNPFPKITKIQILGCKSFLLYSLIYMNIIIYLYSFICILLFIFILLIISYCIIIHPGICIFVILGKGLVSDEDTACAPGVICFFIHYSCPFRNSSVPIWISTRECYVYNT